MSVINNVIFNYVKIKTPAPMYGFKPGCAIANCEYSVDVCLPAATAKALKKKYKTTKSVKNMPTYSAEEYKEAFKIDAPDAETYENSDGDYSVMKLTAYAGFKKTGDPVPEEDIPRVVGSKSKTKDSLGKKVGRDIEVGNGSTGRVSFKERPWDNDHGKGVSLDLTGIQVDVLVEYTAKAKGNVNEFEFEEEDEDEFGYDEGGESEAKTEDEPTGDGETPDDDDEW